MKRMFSCMTVVAALAVAMVLGGSCQRDPIVYPSSGYYLALDVKLSPRTTTGAEPAIYSANFYDVNTHALLYRMYIRPGQHPEGLPDGGYVTGLEPGEYDLLVYSYDSAITGVKGEDWLNQCYAEPTLLSYSNDTPIVNAPDQLYVYRERVKIPYVAKDDDLYIIECLLEPAVEEWRVIVLGIKNLDIAERMTFMLSGQSRGRWMSDLDLLKERCIIAFSGVLGKASEVKSGEDLIIDTPYMTFGKLYGDRRCLLTLQIGGPNGSQYVFQEDVTDQILESQDGDRTIIVTADIEVKPREDGGFNPNVDPWDPEVTRWSLE